MWCNWFAKLLNFCLGAEIIELMCKELLSARKRLFAQSISKGVSLRTKCHEKADLCSGALEKLYLETLGRIFFYHIALPFLEHGVNLEGHGILMDKKLQNTLCWEDSMEQISIKFGLISCCISK